MKAPWRRLAGLLATLAAASIVAAENVDPAGDGSQYAWSENVGWINAEPLGDSGPGLHVSDLTLGGWLWGENLGWISLACANTGSCAAVDYGVTNDGDGRLSGFAWSENAGWISFSCANTDSCETVEFGVRVDPFSGVFSGEAWGENVGWIRFAGTGPHPFGVTTGWRCTPPAGTPDLVADRSEQGIRLSWSAASGWYRFDIVRGTLDELRASGGDYATAVTECIGDDAEATSAIDEDPHPAHWYLVRPANCGAGTYDTAGPGLIAPRDAGLGSAGACS